MIIPDVNLLLYAEFDAFPQHEAARRWWEGAINGDRQVGIPAVSLFGFLRTATSRRIFTAPLPVKDAIARVEAWLAPSHVRFLVAGPHHLEIALALLAEIDTAGNLTTDVQLAAHAIENQADLCSNDRDFGRFSGLRWKNPLDS
ncbi:MAG: type II toxin-antitoxin system VapC family toxin [Candidatus Binatia bacterium]